MSETHRSNLFEAVIGSVAMVTIALLPLVYSPTAFTPFVVPKLVVLRGGAILVTALAALAVIWHRAPRGDLRDPRIFLPLAVLAWSAITTVTSTNVAVSAYGLLYVACIVVLTLALCATAGRFPVPRLVLFLAVPALINVIVLVLQFRHVWSPVPLPDGYPPRQRNSGLLGNPDFLASYLVAPALACIAAAIAFRERRLWYGGAAALFLGGIVLTESMTALIAVSCGIVAAAAMTNWRRAAAALVILALLGGAVLFMYTPIRQRTAMFASAALTGDWDLFVSGRTASVLAAWQMFLDHPLLGVGVHVYQYEFLPYRFEAEEQHPQLLRFASKGSNFGEAHNDHVEVLAETGIPGYLLLLSVLGYVASRSWRATGADPPSRFQRVLAFPLSLSFSILALAQFPLSLAAVVTTWIFAASTVTLGDATS